MPCFEPLFEWFHGIPVRLVADSNANTVKAFRFYRTVNDPKVPLPFVSCV